MLKDSHNLFTNQSISNSTVYSQIVDVGDYHGFAIQAIWTGASANGSLIVETSVDKINFEPEPDSQVTILGAGHTMINLEKRYYRYFRMAVTSLDANPISMYAISISKGAR